MRSTFEELKKKVYTVPCSDFIFNKEYERNVKSLLFFKFIRSGKEIELTSAIHSEEQFFITLTKYRDYLRSLIFDCFLKVLQVLQFSS
jgi:hypothetical protein